MYFLVGIAAGFGSPIGGVLFLIEEGKLHCRAAAKTLMLTVILAGISFWSAPLISYAFLCSACSIGTTELRCDR